MLGRSGIQTRRIMPVKTVKLIVVLILSLGLVLITAQNTDPFEAQFLWFRAEVPAILLLFLTAVGGFILGLLVALISGLKSRSRS